MALRVYNSLTQQKEPFEPVNPGKVGIYLCGPTVYKESHIGHAVGPVIFDAIVRYLEYRGFDVSWVVNITDVEDKLIQQAHLEGCGVYELAERVSQSYRQALETLGVHRITHMPKASEHIADIVEMVEQLIAKDYAYAVGGDVYFDVTRDEDYGKLSNRRVEDQTGQRDLVGDGKRNAGDFALWKAAKEGEPAEVSFPSPWGLGRPGWHIECSAMSMSYLGHTFDFHGGGMDLIFPHHENEIAQSESYSGKTFAKYWLHNGLTRLNTKKLSKSDPEMQDALAKMTLSHLLSRHSGEMMRFFILSTHYRRPIEFSDEEIASKKKGLDSMYRLFERVQGLAGASPYDDSPPLQESSEEGIDQRYRDFMREILDQRSTFLTGMEDDFNTAAAIGALFQMAGAINRFADAQHLSATSEKQPLGLLLAAARTLVEDGRILGLFEKPVERATADMDQLSAGLLDLLVQLRHDAKKDKNYALADRIREALSGLGVNLEDRSEGTRWRIE